MNAAINFHIALHRIKAPHPCYTAITRVIPVETVVYQSLNLPYDFCQVQFLENDKNSRNTELMLSISNYERLYYPEGILRHAVFFLPPPTQLDETELLTLLIWVTERAFYRT